MKFTNNTKKPYQVTTTYGHSCLRQKGFANATAANICIRVYKETYNLVSSFGKISPESETEKKDANKPLPFDSSETALAKESRQKTKWHTDKLTLPSGKSAEIYIEGVPSKKDFEALTDYLELKIKWLKEEEDG